MNRIPFLFTAFVFGLAPLFVTAQETSQPDAPIVEEAKPSEEAPVSSGDESAQSAEGDEGAASQQPIEQVVAVHGDWQIRCRTDSDTCLMYQLAIDARDVPIAEMTIVPLDADDGRVAGFEIITPLRTLLTQGVTLQIDNGGQQKYQFGWCEAVGCVARFAVRSDGLSQFKRGNKTRLTVLSVENPSAPVILDVSLKGFTAAFDDLSKR